MEQVPVSDLCNEYHLQPTIFYRRQKEFFKTVAASFEKASSRNKKAEQKRIQQLEAKLQIKNEVLSELMEENVRLKN